MTFLSFFRKIKKIDDHVIRGQNSIEKTVDEDLERRNWRYYEQEAREALDRYHSQIQGLLDQYGIADEASMVSGHVVDIRNRISDIEKEDFSFMNTDKVVEMRYAKIFKRYRMEFFQDLPDNVKMDSVEDAVENPSAQAMDKASAYYNVAYDGNNRNLSFPWVAWDVLAYIKRDAVFSKAREVLQTDPILDKMNAAIKYHVGFADEAIENAREVAYERSSSLERYCERFEDLIEVFAVIGIWVNSEMKEIVDGVEKNFVADWKIHLLFIKFCLERLEKDRNWDDGDQDQQDRDEGVSQVTLLPYLSERVDTVAQAQRRNDREGRLRLGEQKAEAILQFVKYLGSEKFLNDDCIDLGDLNQFGDRRIEFSHGQRSGIHDVAFRTYHDVALTGRFRSLKILDPNAKEEEITELQWDYAEMEPVMVELEQISDLKAIQDGLRNLVDALKFESGVWSMDARYTGYKSILFLAGGKMENRDKLREILMVEEEFNLILKRVLRRSQAGQGYRCNNEGSRLRRYYNQSPRNGGSINRRDETWY